MDISKEILFSSVVDSESKFNLITKHADLTVSEATRNILVLGGTGSGKTESFCFPILDRLIELGCSGLVLDVKGEYCNFARNLKDNKTLLIGNYKDCFSFNIIAGMKEEIFEGLLNEIKNQSSKEFWGLITIKDLMFFFKYFKYVLLKEPTLFLITEYCFHYEKYKTEVENNMLHLCQDDDLYFTFQQLTKNPESNIGILYSSNNGNNGFSDEQRLDWHKAVFEKTLSPFLNNDFKNSFSSEFQINFEKVLYVEKKVIFLDLNKEEYPLSALFISKILREQVRNCIREKASFYLKQGTLGKEFYTFILIDEYQQYIIESDTKSNMTDDNTWFDTSRSRKHINIISTQGLSSIIAQTQGGEKWTNSVIQNFRNIICFSNNDKPTIEYMVFLLNTKKDSFSIRKKLIFQEGFGRGFFYKGINESNGKTYFYNIKTGDKKGKLKNYSKYINKNFPTIEKISRDKNKKNLPSKEFIYSKNFNGNISFNSVNFKKDLITPTEGGRVSSRSEEIIRFVFSFFFNDLFLPVKADWLKNKLNYQLEIDGYSFLFNIAFEYQGPHHYENFHFYKSIIEEDVFIKTFKQKENDYIKKKLCEKNNITLIRIDYIEELGSLRYNFDDVLKKISYKMLEYDIFLNDESKEKLKNVLIQYNFFDKKEASEIFIITKNYIELNSLSKPQINIPNIQMLESDDEFDILKIKEKEEKKLLCVFDDEFDFDSDL